MEVILFNGMESTAQIVNTLSIGLVWNLVKIAQVVSEMKNLKITQFYTCT